MPANAIYVGRPTVFGNPFRPAVETPGQAVDQFRNWLKGLMYPLFDFDRKRLLKALPNLCGKDLVCWCEIGQPCHADVLLELANIEPDEAIEEVVSLVAEVLEGSR